MTVLLESDAIQVRVKALAAEIERDYPPGEEIHLVCVLKGGFVFMADLIRAMSSRVTLDFIAVSSYAQDKRTSGEVRLLKDLDTGLEGRHVVIVEDIVDTGLTLTYLQDILRARSPKSLKTACLLSKPSRRLVDVTVDYIGFTIEDRFVVGYGLDYAEQYRNLPAIAVLDGEQRRSGNGLAGGPSGVRWWRMKRFDIITEADARSLDPGSTVELARGGHVTPLAQDTLRARRVTVVPAGAADPSLPDGLAPVADVRRVAIGSDHTGVALKRAIVGHLRGRGLAVTDCGTDGVDPVDYPDIARGVALAVARGECDAGIVIDGAGIGSAMAANKVRGVRAAMCPDETIARYSREHNGANVMTLGSSLVDGAAAIRIVDTWLGTAMKEARYIRRLLKIRRIEEEGSR